MLRFAPGVAIAVFTPQLAEVIKIAAEWALVSGVAVDVNSIDDKGHGAGSFHGWSLAIDLDTAGDKPVDLDALHGYLVRHLPLPWQVINEKDHVHAEWDNGRRRAPASPPRGPQRA